MVDTTRFSGMFSVAHLNALVIGAGGIGGPTALALAKMGFREVAWCDDELVSSENTGTQLYGVTDIGAAKVINLGNIIQRLTEYNESYGAVIGRFPWEPGSLSGYEPDPDFIISAVDSIDARKKIWDGIFDFPTWQWYIDARMGAEIFQMWTVRRGSKQVEMYDRMISRQTDEDIPDLPCTSKATFYTGFYAGAKVASTVANIVRDLQIPHFMSCDLTGYTERVHAWT